jgi:hypothetical protein
MTLAPAFSQALPSLVGVRADYTHETNRELLFQLCAALVREGMGNAETWKQAGGSAIRFAQTSMASGIGDERDKLLTRNVEYHLLVSDALERYGEDAQLGSGRLAVLIECGGSGYLKIGPAIEAMEAEAEGLGAAFYWTLTHALYKVMRLYIPGSREGSARVYPEDAEAQLSRRQRVRPGTAAPASQRALQGLDQPVARHRATRAASLEAIEGVPRRGPLRPATIAVPARLLQRARCHRSLFRRREPVDA